MLKRLKPGRQETIELNIKGLGVPILMRRSPRARRFSLQVSEAKRGAVLTVPVYSSFADADAFLSRHLDWLKERLAGLSEPVPFTHGAVIPLRGYAHRIHFAGPVRRRGVAWIDAEDSIDLPAWPEAAARATKNLPRLCVSGEPEHAPRRLADWLKRQAQHDLKDEVGYQAERMGLSPKRIFVRDQPTRWGSCSTTGALSFSWRLILAPGFVLEYLVVHEVAHLAHMNHGPRFWKLVEDSMPDYKRAQKWLREHGASLHRYGVDELSSVSADGDDDSID